MSFFNNLCTDESCKARLDCQHRGPQGQYCFYEHEKALCELLDLDWRPAYTFAELIDQLRSRLSNPDVEDLTANLAERMKPEKALKLVGDE